mgnify:CR=1 FL=1
MFSDIFNFLLRQITKSSKHTSAGWRWNYTNCVQLKVCQEIVSFFIFVTFILYITVSLYLTLSVSDIIIFFLYFFWLFILSLIRCFIQSIDNHFFPIPSFISFLSFFFLSLYSPLSIIFVLHRFSNHLSSSEYNSVTILNPIEWAFASPQFSLILVGV